MSAARVAAAAASVCVLLAPLAADAQLYRWREPGTGTVKLSSIPPPWYGRGVSNGPHVDLIVNGKVVDPLAAPRGEPASPVPSGPLPPPRMALPPPDASHERLVDIVVTGLRVGEQFDGWAPSVNAMLEQNRGAARLPESTRAELAPLVSATFRRERLLAHFTKAFAAEAADADLRAVIEIEQTPLARRVGAIEAARLRQLAANPDEAAVAESRATPERRALADELEQAMQGADLMAAGLAGAAVAVALASPESSRARVAEVLQGQRAEVQPLLRRTFVRVILHVYEPLTDAELRALIEVQRRPAVTRVTRAVAGAYGATIRESLGEFLAGAAPLVAAARR